MARCIFAILISPFLDDSLCFRNRFRRALAVPCRVPYSVPRAIQCLVPRPVPPSVRVLEPLFLVRFAWNFLSSQGQLSTEQELSVARQIES